MKARGIRIWLGIAIIVSVSILGAEFVFLTEGEEHPEAAVRPETRRVSVQVAPVTARTWVRQYVTFGSLIAEHKADIGTAQPGIVSEIRFEEGQAVSAGDVLAVLNSDTERAEVETARIRLEVKQDSYNRTDKLKQRGYQTAAALEKAWADLIAAKSALAIKQARLDNREIRAPFSGVIYDRMLDVGAYMSPGDVLARLEDLSALEVELFVPERYLSRVRPGLPFELTMVASTKTYAGKISVVEPMLDRKTRSVVLRGRLKTRDNALLPGAFVKATLLLSQTPDTVTILESALVASLAGDYVFRVEGDKAVRVDVQTGDRRDGLVVIEQGLSVGDRVVSVGTAKLTDGALVEVVGEETY